MSHGQDDFIVGWPALRPQDTGAENDKRCHGPAVGASIFDGVLDCWRHLRYRQSQHLFIFPIGHRPEDNLKRLAEGRGYATVGQVCSKNVENCSKDVERQSRNGEEKAHSDEGTDKDGAGHAQVGEVRSRDGQGSLRMGTFIAGMARERSRMAGNRFKRHDERFLLSVVLRYAPNPHQEEFQ